MYESGTQQQPEWTEKLKHYAKIGVGIVIVVWLAITANTAKNVALSNQAILETPELDVAFVAGGPLRFADHFEDALDDSGAENVATDDSLWATLIVNNTGRVDTEGVVVDLSTVSNVAGVYTSTPGYWGNEPETTVSDDKLSVQVEFETLDAQDQAMVFVAFQPDRFQSPYDAAARARWAGSHGAHLQRATVEVADQTFSLYGDGVPKVSA